MGLLKTLLVRDKHKTNLSLSTVGGYLLLEVFTQTPTDRRLVKQGLMESPPDCMSHPCFQNRFFIILILSLCAIILFFSCFSCSTLGYKTRTPVTGVLRSGVVIVNAIYLGMQIKMILSKLTIV